MYSCGFKEQAAEEMELEGKERRPCKAEKSEFLSSLHYSFTV